MHHLILTPIFEVETKKEMSRGPATERSSYEAAGTLNGDLTGAGLGRYRVCVR